LRLRSILDALPDMLFVISKDYVFQEYHAPDPEKLIASPDDFVGRPVSDVLPPDVEVEVRTAIDKTLATGESQTVHYSLDLPGGRHWFETISSVCSEDSVLFIVRDRTEQVLTEEKLRISDRLASIGALASGVAHEVNNPLTYVMGNLNLIRSALAKRADPELSAALEDAIHGLDRVRRLVQDLRVFSHPGDLEHSEVDLQRVLDATLRLADGELSRRARLRYEPQDLPTITANESQVGQVILNLLSNAIDAIDPGHPDDNVIAVETGFDDSSVTIRVRDTGVGLPEELGSRIFDPFVTTKALGRGTGLGLSISRSIVEAFGGSIRAEAATPRGTKFEVVFPRFIA
jgi:PAS domain S-box-containing protein